MQISTRLKAIAKYVNKQDKVIDVGCDHALLDIYLIENGMSNKLIVSDVHENALDQGKENIKKHKLSRKITARLGNGLEVLTPKDDINTLIISGMGTATILSILDNENRDRLDKLILQSNNDHTELRDKVIKMGYYIVAEEYLVDNGKNYIIEVFVKGEKEYTRDELYYGPYLIKDKEYLNFELYKIARIKKLIPKMRFRKKIKMGAEVRKLRKLIAKCN